ncbi:MAG: rRNA maturation RNase YbeY [Treponemataceae bacterium]|nr:rRNA maturation RNase YbeY [Treponemataceae bacterium]
MANRVFVSVQEEIAEPQWLSAVEPFMQDVLRRLKLDGQEVSVLFCGDRFIQDLNRTYRGIDSPTDVLSFENGEVYTDEEGSWRNAGDIAVSLDTLPKNAEYFGEDADAELKRLLVHGVLHLNGMDHGDEHIQKGVPPACEMLSLQEAVLSEFSGKTIFIQ